MSFFATQAILEHKKRCEKKQKCAKISRQAFVENTNKTFYDKIFSNTYKLFYMKISFFDIELSLNFETACNVDYENHWTE
jgi:hypothetical protein